jgi:hypothetical protein
MKKQLLTIILLVTLALTGFTALSTTQVKASTSDAKILSYSWYLSTNDLMATYAGDLVVVGELQNNGTSNIYYVYVTGYAYVNDTLVGITQRQVFGNNLETNQKAPFYLDFPPETSQTSDTNWMANTTSVVVVPSYVSNTAESMYQGLTVTSENSTSSGTYTITGSVKNTGSESIGDVRVITTFYNSSGTVVSLNYTEVLSDALSPGASVSFTATPVDSFPASGITSYVTLVQSTVQSPAETTSPTTTPTATATPTATTTVTPTSTPTQTPTANTQDYTLIIVAVAVIVAIIAAVAIIMSRRNHSKTVDSTPVTAP